ncbi:MULTISPECIES: crossover junction endodeoxyribonuclease RuvC [unclassified Beijerinckia]|uniref:crossover junction endodeoxyribonuclease RuvC n=1 Tax=unclassified Beijerinckia TaxID=2638183 RepID=UPI0008949829|nr:MULTISPECIES: crossover junction endodeoxyribonuclease RuvC [unclassified Beijerinckia]MDH7799955.1 crossover junction endodeoxyribonuclease RuvC [Beijerinckia sp. GAS462]SED43835.1 Holliday junction endonuclease RuvC [Beijerinckia sp. 28-YEA-48]
MSSQAIRILGIDPGLRNLGWGIVESAGSRLTFVACGTIHSDAALSLGERLRQLHLGLADVLQTHMPEEAAVEETFVNRDPQSALKLGQARGVALVVPALAGIPVAEYAANLVKKTVVGAGHAEKRQVAMMIKVLLPKADARSADAADALAVAICHAQHRGAHARLQAIAPTGRKTG